MREANERTTTKNQSEIRSNKENLKKQRKIIVREGETEMELYS